MAMLTEISEIYLKLAQLTIDDKMYDYMYCQL